MMKRAFAAGAGFAAALLVAGAVMAQETVKVGLLLPMTGPNSSTGKQENAAIQLYLQQHGASVAGKKVEVILKDDQGNPDVSKRLAQELLVNDKVQVLMGFGLTPLAIGAAPLATQAKVPEIVTAAGTSIITEQSPFIVRTSFTLPQVTVPMADWASKNGVKKAVTLVTDYGPGLDAEKAFAEKLGQAGGSVVEALRAPLASPDFAPLLQRVADAKPDALFVFVPSGFGGIFVKAFLERGLDKSGIKLIATGDVMDDDLLNQMGDQVIGVINSHHYSAVHNSPENKAFVDAFKKANNNMRPNFMAVGGYDGMTLLYKALEKTKGNADGTALVEAMKGMSWNSPRGPISIDPETRDIIQNVYIRKVEKVGGELVNTEFETVNQVKDPVKAAKK
jgi:branched-chain amino acid transport system substrate-binding protein